MKKYIIFAAVVSMGLIGCDDASKESTAASAASSESKAAEVASAKEDAKAKAEAETLAKLTAKSWLYEKTQDGANGMKVIIQARSDYGKDGKGSGVAIMRMVREEPLQGLSRLKGFDEDKLRTTIEIIIESKFDYSLDGETIRSKQTSIDISKPEIKLNHRTPAEFIAVMEGNGAVSGFDAAGYNIDVEKASQAFHEQIEEQPDFKVGAESDDTIVSIDATKLKVKTKKGDVLELSAK